MLKPSRTDTAIGLCLVLICLLALSGVAHNGFVNFDDDFYLTANPMVKEGISLRGIAWAFTTTHAVNWHPFAWLSHMLDVSLFGMRPGAHHLVALLLHTVNAVLLFVSLRRLTGAAWRSALVAAFFAVHPLHVESVAWASERKDLLSTSFTLLALIAWRQYLRFPGAARYAGVCALLAAALLAKPMAVTFPFILLLLDWWPLGRWAPGRHQPAAHPTLLRVLPPAALWREKLPLLLLAAASCVVTFVVQRGAGAMSFGEQLGLPARAANAVLSWVRYLGKTVWPRGLALFYPIPETTPPWWLWTGALLTLALITTAAVRLRGTRPWLGVGWFWYLGTLVPVIGLIQVGGQSMADRYTYLPLTGIFMAASWGLAEIARRHRRLLLPFVGVVIALLGALTVATRAQTAVWRDAETLFRHALQVTERNWMVHHHLGNALAVAGRDEEAILNYRATLAILPFHAPSYSNLGGSYARQGRVEDAESNFRTAIAAEPDYAPAHFNLGTLLLTRGELDEAERQFREANRIQPESAEVLNSLGVVLRREGRVGEAARCFEEALRLDPGYGLARDNLQRLSSGGNMAPQP